MLQATRSLTEAGPEDTIHQDKSAKAKVSGFSTAVGDSNGGTAGYRKHSMSRQPTMPALPEHSSEETM